MSGPEVQANAIWTALHGNPLGSAPGWLTAVAQSRSPRMVAPLAAWRLNVAKSALIVPLGRGRSTQLIAQAAFDKGTPCSW